MILAIAFFVTLGILCLVVGLGRWRIEWFQLALVWFACAAGDALFGALLHLFRR